VTGVNDVDLAAVGALLGDPSRAAMLDALMSGRALTSGELARVASVSASTASEHLDRLAGGGRVESVRQGRHRYFRLSGPQVGAALEALSHIAPAKPVTGLRQSGHAKALGFARTCYDHLAGTCGVAVHDVAFANGWLAATPAGYALTAAGEGAFTDLGIDLDRVRSARRAVARPCLDWTERKPHLAGSLAAGLTTRLLDLGWLVRRSRESRSLRLTDPGRAALEDLGCVLPRG
jgi:DNA-binding transcriptional ArsR family regulator